MNYGVREMLHGKNGNKMKVVHITTIDTGGAYKAVSRLNEALLRQGIESQILLRTKTNKESIGEVFFSNTFSASLSKTKNACNMLLGDGEIARDVWGTDISKHELLQNADIIVLHWINSFLTVKSVMKIAQLGKPILWFMHDMWLFTGGCHCDGYCGRYAFECTDCPSVKRIRDRSIASLNFQEKKALLKQMKRTVIAGPSQWILECASKSSILQNKKILYLANLFNPEIFHAVPDRENLYIKYRMNPNKKIILFGAADTGTANENKGFRYLLSALEKLPRKHFQLLVFGKSENNIKLPDGFDATFCGFVKEETKLAELYTIADVFVNPSNQESFGYTACEALACGTPVVAFPVGGLREQITHKQNGYLARYHDSDDLAIGIQYCAEHSDQLGKNAALFAQKYSYDSGITAYLNVMYQMLKNEE